MATLRLSTFVMLGLALAGCGRSSLLPLDCILTVAPASIDFGDVGVGRRASASVTLDNGGNGICAVDNIAIAGGSDDGFSVSVPSLRIGPGDSATLEVGFSVAVATLPLDRAGTLAFTSNDAVTADRAVPLHAHINSNCTLAVTPAAVDFGNVPLGNALLREVIVTDVGSGACELDKVAIGPGSDSEFTLGPGQPTTLMIPPGQSTTLAVVFTASDTKLPRTRTGTLVFASTDEQAPTTTVPLTAFIDVGCDLTIVPPALDFGNVILNTSATAPVTLGNDGTRPCSVSGIALGAGTDPLFSLAAGQVRAVVVAPGQTFAIPVTFTASDSQPPHLRTGTLVFATGNPRMPNATVPLSAYINTVCVEASRWIYTVDESSMLARFDPQTLTFTDIGQLDCPSSSTPNSMAVDQNAVAWVAYLDGTLWQVDVMTAHCQATTFVPNQQGILDFGMGFVFSPTTGKDTLYIAGGANTGVTQSTLATISFPSLTVTPVATVPGLPELSGLGDGTLWGFVPAFTNGGASTLTEYDPASGVILDSYNYPSLPSSPQNWAMKFWGGSFWMFLGQSIYQVPRNMPMTITTAVAATGRNVVGAGVSTCAPLQ